MNQHLVETVVGQTSLVCLEVHELPRSQNQHAQRKIRDSTAVVNSSSNPGSDEYWLPT